MATRKTPEDAGLGCLGTIFVAGIAAIVWYFAKTKQLSERIFAPRFVDYAHDTAARLRKTRSWLGLLGATAVYVVWRWGEDVGETVMESLLFAPVLAFFKMAIACFVAMTVVIFLVRRGERSLVLKQLLKPASFVLSLMGIAVIYGLYISGHIPAIDSWFPSASTVSAFLKVAFSILFLFVFLAVWFVFIPSSIEHCFRARDGHIALAPITFALFAIWSASESVHKFYSDGLPSGVPDFVGILLLSFGPLTLALISMMELLILYREGADFRSADI